ncbi:type III secretion system inner membrane ring lipoprotein SctJ [Erwinia piriflorinigrans]|uniref:Lipoprotein n=1 Tax=Erwinia piriflorinigrans CFBP 5888 TaxID=1161919 RepID=V5Z5G5_9GAMM|nr:type III secretion inner membrane ring lipoprotein SctJ [Erwinia piriflorinigrans]CCG86219.1 Yop proteins translocation lipoprotein J Lipoprotein ylpB [Erwinia piriflorinigrans CFBP 5888]
MRKYHFRVIIILLTVSLISGCNNEKLLENLSQEQANHVVAILQQHNISAHKSGNLKAGYAVTVGQSENTAALSVINQYQLPWAADVQIGQAFPSSSLVASPNAEQARVLSLQEQRLEQSLRIIAQVVNARVHLSYPSYNSDISVKKHSGHVAVLISYKGEIDEAMFIPQIKSLIKNSLDDVFYENISVVLFPAPMIQYSSPVKAPVSSVDKWLILLTVMTFCAIATGGYLFYQASRRPVKHNSTPCQKEEVINEA